MNNNNFRIPGIQKKIWYAPNKKEAYGDKEIQAVVDCLNDGWLAGFGPKSIQFEKEVSVLFGKKHGLFVNSGSSAILLGIHALDLKPGDEVVTPACTFSTTLAPIIQCGLTPVFCDVEIGTYVPSPEQVCEKITDRTRLIILPNLIGSKPDWSEIRRRVDGNILLFEDSADTITYTPDTDIAITSFYSSHLITAAGSGGMVMFNNEKYLKRATMFRDWGRIGDNTEDIKTRFEYSIDGIPYDYKFLYGAVGYNMKSSEMNAAFGLVQLSRIEEIRAHRKMIFNRYIENLRFVNEITLPINKFNSDWLAIPFMYKNRLQLLTFLEKNNIQTRVCFAGNVTRHPVYRQYLQEFKNADRIMAEGFLLGAHHGMTIEDVDYVTDKIKEFINNKVILLVTGGCGFIGSNFINYYFPKNKVHKLINLDILDYCASEDNVDEKIREASNYIFIKEDINNPYIISNILKKYSVTHIIHFAAQSHVQNSFEDSIEFTKNNVLGTHNLLECCRKYNTHNQIQKFIHVSTDEVYGESMLDLTEQHKTENTILCPTNPYAATKAGAEIIAQSYWHSFKFPIIITRGNNVFGPNQYPEKLIPLFIKLLKDSKKVTIQGDGSTVRAFLHVDDTASAFECILENGEIGEIYNIGSESYMEYSVMDIAKILIKLIKGDNIEPSDYIEYIPDRPFNDKRYYISNDKLKKLGWNIKKINFIEELNNLIN